MANPFYIQPGADFGPGLQGLAQTIALSKENQQRRQERDETAQKFAQAKKAIMEAYRSNDPEKMLEVSLEFPELGEAVTAASRHRSTTTSDNYTDSLFEVLADPSEENMSNVVRSRQESLRLEGVGPEGSVETDSFLDKYKENPEKMMKEITNLAIMRDPNRYKAMREAMAPAAGEKLTSSRKDFEFARSEGFDGSFVDFKQATSGVGPKTEVEMLKLRAQISDIEERSADRREKATEAKIKKETGDRTMIEGIDSILSEIGSVIEEVRKSPSATGLTGAATAMLPGSPSYNMRRRLDMVKANIGFDKLQRMKASSPTGGALGQVSERELNFLQSTLAALDPNMGDEELIKGLDKVKVHYENWKQTLLGEIPNEVDTPVSEMTIEQIEKALIEAQ